MFSVPWGRVGKGIAKAEISPSALFVCCAQAVRNGWVYVPARSYTKEKVRLYRIVFVDDSG